MDVYGTNPVIRKQSKSKLLKQVGDIFSEDWWENWNALSEEDKIKYSEDEYQQQEDNPGIYFRNNVWWWRPLWDYIYDVCPDILGGRYHGGHNNGGTEFTNDEAKEIAAKLLQEIDEGNTEAYQKLYEIRTEDDEFEYPFDVENVRNFAEFCKDSGGFLIQ